MKPTHRTCTRTCLNAFLTFSLFCIISCGAPAVVYVCGDAHNVTTNLDLACYWKDGVRTDLGEPTHNSQARGVFVYNNDVYAVGYYSDNDHTIACYWKNGVKTDLEQNTYNSKANAVYYDGVHLYVSGLSGASGNDVAVIWVDGEVMNLGPLGMSSTVNSITFSDNFVYAAGSVESAPTYFKYDVTTRSVETNEFSSSIGELTGIVVNGADVYVSGFVAEVDQVTLAAAYWKNGVLKTLSTGPDVSVGFGMAVDGENIFVTGMFSAANIEDPQPVYWANGTKIALSTAKTDDRGPGLQIAVVDGSVYIAGLYMDGMDGTQTYRIPAYWKDGVRTDLMPAGTFGSAIGMFIEQ